MTTPAPGTREAGAHRAADAPAVSVVVAARDAADTLDAALRSVARQTWTDWECLVVDDGSRDATPTCAQAWAARDRRFRVLMTDSGERGVVPARNRALAAARGGWVAIHDADDCMHRGRLAEQLALARAGRRVDLVGCHARHFPSAAVGPGLARYADWLRSQRSGEQVWRERFVEMPLAHPGLLIRAATLREVGGYRDRGWPEDWDLLLRLLARGARCRVLARPRFAWRVRPDSTSRTDPRYTLDAFMRCRAQHLADELLAARDDYLLWGYGGTGRALARALAAHGKEPHTVLEVDPGKIGQRIRGAPVVDARVWLDAQGASPPRRPAQGGPPLIVSVAGSPARDTIRTAMRGVAWQEGTEWVFAA